MTPIGPRPWPSWQGCRVIAVGEIFLMNGQVRDSLDGRYFGPVSTDNDHRPGNASLHR